MAINTRPDIAYMLRDAGRPLVYNDNGEEVSGYGIRVTDDREMLEVDGGAFAGRHTVVKTDPGTFPKLAEGAEFIWDDTAYRVTGTRLRPDGTIDVYCYEITS